MKEKLLMHLIANKEHERIIAGVLSVLGLYWAIMLGPISIAAPGIGLMLLPGWVIYVGWWIRFVKEKEMNQKKWKAFWVSSIVVNLTYFLLFSHPYGKEYGLSLNTTMHGWWAFAVLLSIVGLIASWQNKTLDSTSEAAPPSRIS